MIPVPGYAITTPYGRRGPYWSCDEDAYGNGIHTGADYAAPAGTPVVAARPGRVVYCSHGSSFGYHQLEVLPGDGTRDFYAHMPSRAVADGAQVAAGQRLGVVGSEGNATGPHLHFERHSVATGGWSCAVVRDPAPSISYQPAGGSGGAGAGGETEDEEMPKFSRTKLTKPVNVTEASWKSLTWDSVPNGDAGTEGWAAVEIGPSTYTATLVVKVSASGEAMRTRFIEQQKKGDTWEPSETYPGVEHVLTSGETGVSDTRTQHVPADTRLVAQVWLPEGGTVESAELDVLYF